MFFSFYLSGSVCVSAEFCTESVPMQTNEGEVEEESSSKVSISPSRGTAGGAIKQLMAVDGLSGCFVVGEFRN